MTKHFCDCCGAQIETWYTVEFKAQSETDQWNRCTTESLSNSIQNVFAPKKIYCKSCVDRAKAELKPQEENND